MTAASTASIRLQIESALARRIPSALTPAQRIIRPVVATGVAAVDEVLQGGLPIGAITEMTGPESSGRTSLALSFLAGVTREGNVGAWIDAGDTLHPESAAASGVDLSRLLWVRCGVSTVEKPEAKYQFALDEKYFQVVPAKKEELFGVHPRNEADGLSHAIGNLLNPEVIAARCAEPQSRRKPEQKIFESALQLPAQKSTTRARLNKPWGRIEQALRATDLLLQGGGFSVIVLDMAGIAPQWVSRIELAIWFRYRAAVEKNQACLLLLTQHPCAKSAGELLLRFHSGTALCDEKTVFTGMEHRLEIARRRFAQAPSNVVPLRKQPQRENAAQWQSRAAWAGAR